MFGIQSMPSMPYGSMQMPIGWNELSMPTEGCSLHMPIVIRHLHRACSEFSFVAAVIIILSFT